MTRVRLEDLPPAMRAQVLAASAGTTDDGETAGTPTRRTVVAAAGRGPAYRCVACDETFTTYGRWQTHSDRAGHRRGEASLVQAD